jgi:hypothetical protein
MGHLGAEGLTPEQVAHFDAHGWLVLESVLDETQCQTYVNAIDQSCRYHHEDWHRTSNVTWLHNTHLLGDVYLDWFILPGIVEAGRQLLDVSRIWTNGPVAAITAPHPDRHDDRGEVLDTDTWGWHRDTNDKTLANRKVGVNFATFLFPASAENGATAVLDGSHRIDGTYSSLKDECAVVQAEAPAGSVFIFAADSVHSSAPVVSDVPRYAMINSFDTSWEPGPAERILENWTKGLRNDGLRALFSAPTEENSPQPA